METRLAVYRETDKWLRFAAEDLSMQYGGECKHTLYSLQDYLTAHENFFPKAAYQTLLIGTEEARAALRSLDGMMERYGKAGGAISAMTSAFKPILEQEEAAYTRQRERLEYALQLLLAALNRFESSTSTRCLDCLDACFLARILRERLADFLADDTASAPDDIPGGVTVFLAEATKTARDLCHAFLAEHRDLSVPSV